MPGLYIHIPFCKQACHYCDFHFTTNSSTQEEMINAICDEIVLQKDYLLNRSLDSIYLGGGTPSLLSEKQLIKIIERISEVFTLNDSCEVTLEANPDDLSLERLMFLRQAGINRLSVGVQSFDDAILKFLNRSHNSSIAQKALENCRLADFENISIDLIYAIPGQSHDLLKTNINKALKFKPEHFSVYSLTIEPKTVFGNWARKEKITPVDDTFNAAQFEIVSERLIEAGYEHYEISNFCRPGFHSRHNSSYWTQEPYLGIGPSAHSYNSKSRQFNVRNNAHYLKSIKLGSVPFEKEELTKENRINEYVFTTLRTNLGCNVDKLRNDFEFDFMKVHSKYIDKLIANEMAALNNGKLTLTFKGKLLADQIALDLMI